MRKLRILIAVPGAVAVLLASLTILILRDWQARQDLRLRTRSAVVAVSPKVKVFLTPRSSDEEEPANLDLPIETLRLLPGFEGLVVWSPQGRVLEVALAEASRSLVVPEIPQGRSGDRLERDRLLVWQAFYSDFGGSLGKVGLLVDLRRAQELFWHRILLALLLTLGTGLLLWVATPWLTASIAGPFLGLHRLQERVRERHHLPPPEADTEGDEIREVVEGYRLLVAQLEAREAELHQGRDRAHQDQRARSLYLAGVSHELRTPLMAILSYAQTLADAEPEPGALTQDVEHLQAAGQHLLELIDQILDLSRLEAGRVDLRLEEAPVAQVVQEVLSTVEPLVKKNGNTLEVSLEGGGVGGALGTLKADLTRCRQILLNLLGNAANFTREGRIGFRVWREPGPRCDRLFFQVRDQGMGITPQQMERLFEPFVRVEEGPGGSGLGLAISRRFARLMGGEISVVSEPGKGSTFTLQLPAEVLAPGEEEQKIFHDSTERPVPEAGQDRPLALVLDYEADSREVLEAMLAREGFRVRGSDTTGAVLLARRLRPKLMLLAIKIPPQPGWNLLGKLRADPGLHDVPVIIVSPLNEREKALSLGASDLLAQPFDRKRLTAAVEACMGRPAAPTALVVEDDPAARDMLRRTLEEVGWRVTEADQGVTALRSVTEFQPRLIVLDLKLPELDGFGFLRELRKSPEGRSIAILVVTGRDLLLEEERGLGPVVGILRKGIWTLEELRREVSNLGRSQLGRWTSGDA